MKIVKILSYAIGLMMLAGAMLLLPIVARDYQSFLVVSNSLSNIGGIDFQEEVSAKLAMDTMAFAILVIGGIIFLLMDKVLEKMNLPTLGMIAILAFSPNFIPSDISHSGFSTDMAEFYVGVDWFCPNNISYIHTFSMEFWIRSALARGSDIWGYVGVFLQDGNMFAVGFEINNGKYGNLRYIERRWGLFSEKRWDSLYPDVSGLHYIDLHQFFEPEGEWCIRIYHEDRGYRYDPIVTYNTGLYGKVDTIVIGITMASITNTINVDFYDCRIVLLAWDGDDWPWFSKEFGESGNGFSTSTFTYSHYSLTPYREHDWCAFNIYGKWNFPSYPGTGRGSCGGLSFLHGGARRR